MRRQNNKSSRNLIIASVLMLLLHVLFGLWSQTVEIAKEKRKPSTSIVVNLSEPEEEKAEPEKKPQPKRFEPGQIVELPDPKEVVEPEKADYLAKKARTVPEEMRSEKTKMNPEVLAPEFSEESKMNQEDITDLQIDKPSTGATVGKEPMPESEFALFPNRFSKWEFTNKAGMEDPVPASHTARDMRGAPQNDYLNEKVGKATLLNSREFLYADYFNKVRRLVNFWWSQNLDNIPASAINQPLRRPNYRTAVLPTLDADGQLVDIKLLKGCGVQAFDEAVVMAWKSAAPFPKPPKGLVENNQAQLVRFDFILELGQGQSQYMAVDPGANVRFPGIAWPR